MATASVRSELSCSVCREIYTDPVTLSCGHNYCLVCIQRTWDWQSGIEEDPSCPQCRQRYRKQPQLNRNLTLCNIAEKFHLTDPQNDWTGIFCTYCDSLVPAAKSCLHCEASLCDYHVRKHNKSEEHVFTKPKASFEDRKCSIHKRMLEFYCTEDGACICSSCSLVGDHRWHNVELLSEASEWKKEKQRKVLEKLSPEREETEGQIQRLQERRREVAEKAAGETERITALFRDIREQLEALEKRLLIDISREQEKVSHQLHVLIQELEIKKYELSRKIRHIEELCNMADPLTVLQEPESEDSEHSQCYHTDGGDITGTMAYSFSRCLGIAYSKETHKQKERDDIEVPAVEHIYVNQVTKTLLTGLTEIGTLVKGLLHSEDVKFMIVGRTIGATNVSLFLNTMHINKRTQSDESSQSSRSAHDYWDMVGCYSGGSH